MDFAIPMGRRNHSKETMELSKDVRKNMFETKSYWGMLKSGVRNMLIKHESMLSLKLSNMCG